MKDFVYNKYYILFTLIIIFPINGALMTKNLLWGFGLMAIQMPWLFKLFKDYKE